MEQVFNAINDKKDIVNDTWNTIISSQSLDKAWAIVTYTLEQKWALMPTPFGIVDDDAGYVARYHEHIAKFLTSPVKPMTATKASQNRLAPRLPDPITGRIQSRVNVESTLSFMDKLKNMGFGTIETLHTGNNKRLTKVFVKRKYEALDDIPKGHLKKLKVSQQDYDTGCGDEQHSDSETRSETAGTSESRET